MRELAFDQGFYSYTYMHNSFFFLFEKLSQFQLVHLLPPSHLSHTIRLLPFILFNFATVVQA